MLKQRREAVSNFLSDMQLLETQVRESAEESRLNIESEISLLEEQLAAKKSQLLKKNDGEMDRKLSQLHEQFTGCDVELKQIDKLLERTSSVINLNSQYSFLAFCLPLIQDVKVCVQHDVDTQPHTDAVFPKLSTDQQVRMLSELDLVDPIDPLGRSGSIGMPGATDDSVMLMGPVSQSQIPTARIPYHSNLTPVPFRRPSGAIPIRTVQCSEFEQRSDAIFYGIPHSAVGSSNGQMPPHVLVGRGVQPVYLQQPKTTNGYAADSK